MVKILTIIVYIIWILKSYLLSFYNLECTVVYNSTKCTVIYTKTVYSCVQQYRMCNCVHQNSVQMCKIVHNVWFCRTKQDHKKAGKGDQNRKKFSFDYGQTDTAQVQVLSCAFAAKKSCPVGGGCGSTHYRPYLRVISEVWGLMWEITKSLTIFVY